MRKLLAIFIAMMLSIGFAVAQNQKLVVGYFANNQWNNLADCDLSGLTHLNISFANPNQKGEIEIYNRLEVKKELKRAKSLGVKTLLAVAGGGLSGEQQKIWANCVKPSNVDKFIDNIIQTLLDDNYDGIDLDLEHDHFLNMLGSNYAPFVKKLHKKLKEHNLLLSTALFGRHRYAVMTSEVLSLFDYINVMAYDATGNWNLNRPGQHSPMELASGSIEFWRNQGVPREKIILGLPFYGYDFDDEPISNDRSFGYSMIVQWNPEYAYLDEVGKKYYNGIYTIKNKTLLSENECGGIMIWHISCDTKDEYSLMKAIKDAKEEYAGNIARGKRVRSSKLERQDCPAKYLTDGNPMTRWAGLPLNPAIITIDLEEVLDIDSVVIDWESSYGKTFELLVSKDKKKWDKVASFEEQELQVVSNHARQDIKNINAKARYLKLMITKGTEVNGKVWCYSIWDLRVFKKKANSGSEPTVVNDLNKQDYSVYPNPVKTSLRLDGLALGSELYLYSSRGVLLLETKGNSIDFSTLPQGVYFLVANGITKKIIKE